jgi:NAD(P)-dependent dehydrogenase (short-subunit alcohol dehydrogenase family)
MEEAPMSYAPLIPQGRVVLISGANRGIGRAIAERLYADGFTLSLGARRTASLAPVLAGMSPDRAAAHAYDASERQSAAAWVAATAKRFGRIDALVNNAGIGTNFTVEDEDESALDEMWTVNTKGPLRLIRAAFPLLKAAGAGRVVNIVSLSGKRVAGEALTGYSMSKFATMALTHAVRYSGWEHGIRATAICPGYVATDMTADVTALPPEKMIQPGAIAALVSTVLSLPNSASVAEIPVNCRLEHSL